MYYYSPLVNFAILFLVLWLTSGIVLLVFTIKSPRTKYDWLTFFPILWLLFNWCVLLPILGRNLNPDHLVLAWKISPSLLYLVLGGWLWADFKAHRHAPDEIKYRVRPFALVVNYFSLTYIWYFWIVVFKAADC